MATDDRKTDQELLYESFERRVERRHSRREFFRRSAGLATGAAGVMALAACDGGGGDDGGGETFMPPVPEFGAPGDGDILNFALNLEYLEAQFYSFATTGAGLPDSVLGGTGNRGGVAGGRQVNFTDPTVRDFAREIAADEAAHVNFIRGQLGGLAVAQPSIDISASPTGAFSAAARAAGLVGAGQAFDPYANDENFLLGAFIFEDVGVTAFKGAAPLISNKFYLEAAAGILAAEAYHAALIRTTLFQKGVQTPSLRQGTVAISNARDSLDGASDVDQGVVGTADMSNIAPLDANGLAFSRTPGQVLNIVYLTAQAAGQGGFFPNGTNGFLKTSAAS